MILSSRVGADALDDSNPLEWDAKLQIPGVSLSLVTNRRVELLYALVSGIEAEVHSTPMHLRTTLRISKAQIDNQTSLGPPAAFVSPVPAVGSSQTGALPAGAFLLLEAELSNKVKGLAYWKRVSVEVGNLMLQLQEDWLYLLLDFEKGECR